MGINAEELRAPLAVLNGSGFIDQASADDTVPSRGEKSSSSHCLRVGRLAASCVVVVVIAPLRRIGVKARSAVCLQPISSMCVRECVREHVCMRLCVCVFD